MAKVATQLVQSVRGRPSAHTMLTFYKDALLPDNVDPADVANLLRKGMIEEVQLNG